MAHSKSAIKRWRQSLKRRDRNRSTKSATRTLLTKALASIQDDASTAEEPVRAAVAAIDKAAQKGVIHPNAAARTKSRLLKRYNIAIASNVAAAAGTAGESDQEQPQQRRGRGSRSRGDDSNPARGGRSRKT